MLGISKLTDYATVILAALAQDPGRLHTATALAEQTQIAAPTVSKLLKQLQRAAWSPRPGVCTAATVGPAGRQITAASILDALEGPLALTDCPPATITAVSRRVRRRPRLAACQSCDSPISAGDQPCATGGARRRSMCDCRRWTEIKNAARLWQIAALELKRHERNQQIKLKALFNRGYQHGFVTDIESDTVPPGLDEDVVRLISRKKGEPEFLTEWRLKAYVTG